MVYNNILSAYKVYEAVIFCSCFVCFSFIHFYHCYLLHILLFQTTVAGKYFSQFVADIFLRILKINPQCALSR